MNNYYYSSELSTFEYRYDMILSASGAQKFTNAREMSLESAHPQLHGYEATYCTFNLVKHKIR